jgi:hypothetical protein
MSKEVPVRERTRQPRRNWDRRRVLEKMAASGHTGWADDKEAAEQRRRRSLQDWAARMERKHAERLAASRRIPTSER